MKAKLLILLLIVVALGAGVAATCEPAKPPAPEPPVVNAPTAPGSIALVGSKWVGGNLVFTDKSGNTIFTIDGTNRRLQVDSSAALTGPLGTVTSGVWNATSIGWGYFTKDAANSQIQRPTIGAGNMSGTWTAAGTVTLPAVTLGGDVTGNSKNITGLGDINGLTITADIGTVTSGTWQGASVGFAYMQLSRGRTSIPSGSTAASVTHNLSTTPTQVILSWIDTTAIDPMTASQVYIYASVLDSTTFTVNVGAALNNRPSIAWLAIP